MPKNKERHSLTLVQTLDKEDIMVDVFPVCVNNYDFFALFGHRPNLVQ